MLIRGVRSGTSRSPPTAWRAHPETGSNISPRWRESRPKSHSPEHPKTMDFECSKSCPSPNAERVWMKRVWIKDDEFGEILVCSKGDRPVLLLTDTLQMQTSPRVPPSLGVGITVEGSGKHA
jgi:hypothetical protein